MRRLAATVMTGVVVGCAATLLKGSIAGLTQLVSDFCKAIKMWIGIAGENTPNWMGMDGANNGFSWLVGMMPMVGILLAGVYQRRILRREISYGEYRLLCDLRQGDCRLPVVLTYAPLLAATVTLGFGGSAGSEGPIAYSGGAIGSNFGQRLRLPTEDISYLTAIGAAAGIAGIFQAPIGGALFAIEILGLPMTGAALCSLFAACIISSSTANLLSGTTANIPAILHPISIDSTIKLLPIILLFGLFCGLYSRYFSLVMRITRKALERISAHWLRCLVAGATVGLTVLLLPGLYGEGYNIIQQLLTVPAEAASRQLTTPLLPSNFALAPLLTAFGMLILKGIATSATTNGGGVAGDFAPTIMIGAVAGFLFATAANMVSGNQLPISDFVLMGMAGVLAGVVKAPLMATFLITETATMGGGLLLPIAIVAYISYLMVRALSLIDRKPQSSRPNDDCRGSLRSDSQE